jgi:hypothetical protein
LHPRGRSIPLVPPLVAGAPFSTDKSRSCR